MKNFDFEEIDTVFSDFTLTVEEMIYIKGGDSGEPDVKTSPLTVRI